LGRNRKKAFQKLPKYVYADRKRIVYKPPGNKAIVIGNIYTPIADIWELYKQATGQSQDTLDYIVGEYLKGVSYPKLADKKERKRQLEVVLNTDARGRFGGKRYDNITPGTIRKYLDYKGTVAANREIAALSAAWSYRYERDVVWCVCVVCVCDMYVCVVCSMCMWCVLCVCDI